VECRFSSKSDTKLQIAKPDNCVLQNPTIAWVFLCVHVVGSCLEEITHAVLLSLFSGMFQLTKLQHDMASVAFAVNVGGRGMDWLHCIACFLGSRNRIHHSGRIVCWLQETGLIRNNDLVDGFQIKEIATYLGTPKVVNRSQKASTPHSVHARNRPHTIF